jgi:flagellar biosynthesis protein FliP
MPSLFNKRFLLAALTIGLLLFCNLAGAAVAATAIDPLSIPVATIGEDTVSMPLQVLLMMTVLTLLPAALLGLTAFTRIVIVLALLRQALGTGQAPSNQAMIALALFLTVIVMTPVGETIWSAGVQPYLDGEMEFKTALVASAAPLREFMLGQIRDADLMMFAGLSGSQGYATPEQIPFSVLAASFLTSEFKTAFEIGFLLFVPFVVIDLVVASVLMSMGMMMLSPMLVSAPFKILLFVLADGWVLVVGSLVNSFKV